LTSFRGGEKEPSGVTFAPKGRVRNAPKWGIVTHSCWYNNSCIYRVICIQLKNNKINEYALEIKNHFMTSYLGEQTSNHDPP